MNNSILLKSVSVLLFLLFNSNLFAQDPAPTLQWAKSMNGQNTANERQYHSVRDASGNIYVGGNNDNDIIVIKYDNTGNILHTYSYNNYYNGIDILYDLELDSDNNLIVCGYSFVDYKYSLTLAKFAPNGDLLWDYINIGDVYNTERAARGIAIDNNDNIYFAGARNDSLYIGYLNENGQEQWFVPFIPSTYTSGVANDIVVDNSGNAYVCGKIKNVAGNFDAVTFKINNLGTVLWTKYVSGIALGDDEAKMIRIDNSSNVFVGGNVADTSASNWSGYLTKYNASGGQQWLNKAHILGQFNAEASTIYNSPTGTTFSAVQIHTDPSNSYTNIYSISNTGVVNWVNTVNDIAYNNEKVTGITFDNSGNVRIIGYTYNPQSDVFMRNINVSTGATISSGIHTSPLYIFNTSDLHIDNSNNILFPVSLYTTYKVALVKYDLNNNFDFESIHSSIGNPSDFGFKIISNGNSSIYTLGQVDNSFTSTDVVVSKYDAFGDLQWQNIIDEGYAYNAAHDMGTDTAYNIYVLGEKDYTQTFVVKHDSIGAPQWTKYLPGQYRKMVVNNANGQSYYAGFEAYNFQQSNFSAFKVGANGNTLWQFIAANNPNFYVNVASVDNDDLNRLFVLGEQLYDINGPSFKKKIMLQKFSSTGTLQWTRFVSNIDSTNAAQYEVYGIKVITDGSNNAYVLCAGKNGTNAYNFYSLIKYDPNGNILWRTDFNHNNTNHEVPTDMIINNGFITVLSHYMFGGINVTHFYRSSGIHYDNLEIPSIGYQTRSVKLDKDTDDNIYVAGERFSTSTLRDMIFHKLDSTLNLQWTQIYDGEYIGEDVPADMKVTNNGRMYVVGKANNTSGQYPDFVVLKLCDILINPISISTNPLHICPGDTVLLTAADGVSYEWNVSGQTDDSIWVNTTGDYFASVIKGDGCAKNTDTVSVQVNSIPLAQQLCIATVDTTSSHNVITWDKTSVLGADGFKLYREVAGIGFVYSAYIPYDSLSQYVDSTPGINPNIKRERYAMSIVDTCGNEGPLGDFHQTIYLAPPVINGNNVYLEWFDYVGLPAGFYYRILRDTSSNGTWTVVDSVASSVVLNYNDLGILVGQSNLKYLIEIVTPNSCDPTRAVNNNSTRSNRTNNMMAVGIDESKVLTFSIQPNPSTGNITVQLPTGISNYNLQITDLTGAEVKTFQNQNQLDLSMLSNGIYFVNLYFENQKVSNKIVINH